MSGLIAAIGVDCYTAWVGDESFVEPALHPCAAERLAVVAALE